MGNAAGQETVLKMTNQLELRGITKRYPGTLANDDISLSVAPGEVHALLGENGAGKSTLVKIIYGVVRADAGEILWEGRPLAVRNPAQARHLGIGMVFQHFNLFDTLTQPGRTSVRSSSMSPTRTISTGKTVRPGVGRFRRPPMFGTSRRTQCSSSTA